MNRVLEPVLPRHEGGPFVPMPLSPGWGGTTCAVVVSQQHRTRLAAAGVYTSTERAGGTGARGVCCLRAPPLTITSQGCTGLPPVLLEQACASRAAASWASSFQLPWPTFQVGSAGSRIRGLGTEWVGVSKGTGGWGEGEGRQDLGAGPIVPERGRGPAWLPWSGSYWVAP